MKKSIATLAAVFALSLLPAALPAQNPPATQQHFYRMHFAVEELSAAGKVTNTRTYQETISTDNGRAQQIKTGSKVPVATGSYGANSAMTQYQYIDLGVDLSVLDPKEHGGMLGFRLMANVSSIAHQTNVAGTNEPVIRQNSWDSTVSVPIGKPTVVFSSDDLDSTGKMQIEVTANPVE